MSDDLIGRRIGTYDIETELGTSRGKVYRAVQTSMHRAVALKLVAPEIAALPGKADHFRESAQAAASIVHPNIVAVYEAGVSGGYHFCAMEYMDGLPLKEFLRKGHHVDEHHVLLVIIGAARALDFLWTRKIQHQPPAACNFLTTAEEEVKLINVMPEDAPPSASPKDDLLALGMTLATVANDIGPVSCRVSELVERMMGAGTSKPFTSLLELGRTAEALDLELFPPAPPPQPQVERIQPKQSSHAVGVTVMCIVLVGLLAGVVYLVIGLTKQQASGPPPLPKRPTDIGAMIQIPAGDFIFQHGQTRRTAAYFIDKYEVTIGEYKRFIDALAGGATVEEHAFAGRRKDHRPANWDLMQQAINGRMSFNGGFLTWDTPIFGIDWYDAYAYSRFRGKRLPTEDEWEKAARGTGGFQFPWGNTSDSAKANGAGGLHPKWSEVYAYPNDKSQFGVLDTAGNVSEWTATQTARGMAVVRGPSWQDQEVTITKRLTNIICEARTEVIGFRCAADKEIKP